jgi:formate hydrogenlyase transcriptional activator
MLSRARHGGILLVTMEESEQAQSGFNVAEGEWQRRLDQLRLLLEINNSVVSHLDLRELFKVVSQCLRQMIHHDAAGLSLYDAETDRLRLYVLESQSTDDTPVTEGEWLSLDDTPGGRAFHLRQPLLVQRDVLESYSAPIVERVIASGVRSADRRAVAD